MKKKDLSIEIITLGQEVETAEEGFSNLVNNELIALKNVIEKLPNKELEFPLSFELLRPFCEDDEQTIIEEARINEKDELELIGCNDSYPLVDYPKESIHYLISNIYSYALKPLLDKMDDEHSYEMCPYCEEEVELPLELGVYKCPNCGRWIVNCSMCRLCDIGKCDYHVCPLSYEADLRNKEEGLE